MMPDVTRSGPGPAQAASELLADLLAKLLTIGLPQDQASLDLVLAALGEPSRGADPVVALARLRAGPDTAEHAHLTALLLSPGPLVLRALEPALAQADLDAAGGEALAEALAQRLADGRGRVLALLPDGSKAELPASAEGLRVFVRRLRPAATAPAELRAILNLRCEPEQAAELAVLLRHSRLAWTPGDVFFLATLLARADPRADDLPGLVAWATGFLGASGPGFEPRRELALRRQALLAQLRQAQFLDEALARGSYETLISQGLRLAHVHGPDIRAELGHLERAGMLVLGLSGAALDGFMVRDLGQAGDASALLRLLPGPED